MSSRSNRGKKVSPIRILYAATLATIFAGCQVDHGPCFGLQEGQSVEVTLRENLPFEISGDPRAIPSCGSGFDFDIGDQLSFIVTQSYRDTESCDRHIAAWQDQPSGIVFAPANSGVYSGASVGDSEVFTSYGSIGKGSCSGDWGVIVMGPGDGEGEDPFVPYNSSAPAVNLFRTFLASEGADCPGMTLWQNRQCRDRFGVEMSPR
jgi:hypothetical protein